MTTDNKKEVKFIIDAISIGTKLAFSVISGGFIGILINYLIKRLFGIDLFALFLIVGLFIGFIGGIYYAYKTAYAIG
ncbi:MAG: hypothetical protein LRZ92_06585 [Methanosarcinaceae archaeon]|jgi:F0F1-type ATP synthase assembly protein I|nr:hypothetical protein [Methanosarcinaceae archaeon]NKQ38451.1 hypothetical protein [Methanosarcinales archaeon]